MTTVLEGLAIVLNADERVRDLTRKADTANRKLEDAMEHVVKLEATLAENDVEIPERPYSISR